MFRGTRRDWKNKNSHMNCFFTYMLMGLEREKKDKVQVPQRNEMLSLYCTALGFISKSEEYNPEQNILNSRYTQ